MYYQHFKGGKYKVISEAATDTASGKTVVVYRSLDNFNVYTRPYEEFHGMTDKDGKKTKRFTLIQKPNKKTRKG